MIRMFLAPRRYIQGDGAIHEIGVYAARLGTKALLIGGKRALAASAQAIQASLKEKNIDCYQELFKGECSDNEINRLVALAKQEGSDFIIASGGGKVIDTGKVAAHIMKVPIMVVPTIAATDAPCSAVAVVYTDESVFQRYIVLPHNPDCVLVDTRIIAGAPVETFVSGMGDALATFWEADTCARSCKPNILTGGTPPTRSAIALARLCYDTLLQFGLQAKLAVENHCITPAVEAIVEANTLLSGLGFESGGLAGAHSVHNGLTVLNTTHHNLHGQKVAFGTLTQLVMEGRPLDDIYEVLDFCLSVGLPVCLDDLDIHNPTREEIRKVAEATTAPGETIHATWFEVTPDMVESAIWTASALSVNYRM